MENYAYYHEYLSINGEKMFTVILLPKKDGQCPTVIFRTPYVDNTLEQTEESIVRDISNAFQTWLNRGYAIVYQHCRGQGKSTGAFVPYVHEREDGLALLKWIRSQPFYNGELFLVGGSYGASLHYATSPFEKDIKGAVFEVQDSERYRLWYRNGQMRKGHANWHFALYKRKCGLHKNFSIQSFAQLPLASLSQRVLGDRADDFEQMLTAQNPKHTFWNTRFGGADTNNAILNANIPILLTTGYNDFYVGGVFKMWNALDIQTKEKSALLVSPYNHGDGYDTTHGLSFPNGKRAQAFGATYAIDWFDNIRKSTPLPYKKGVITYYRAFENNWASDFYERETKDMQVSFGEERRSFEYDPLHPPAFCGEGLCVEENDRKDILTLQTRPFEKDTFIKGQMRAVLKVASSCADTTFYIRISLKNEQFTYALRHDITSLCYQLGDYEKNSVVTLHFSFDEYAFLIKRGNCLQIDIAGTDDNTYISHTNKKGEYALQTEAETATNMVYLKDSYLVLPVETEK